MRGAPKVLATKEDYKNMLHDYPLEAKEMYDRLSVARLVWVCTYKLLDPKTGVIDSTHKLTDPDDVGDVYQMELKEDPKSLFCQLGLTI
jgi:hypothetical protein